MRQQQQEYEQPKQTHQKCSKCGGHECVTVFQNDNTYCHQCEHKTYGGTKGMNQQQQRNNSYHQAPPQEDLKDTIVPYRSIGEKAVRFYGVKTQVNTKTGKEAYRVYDYPHQSKRRMLEVDKSAAFKNPGFTNDHLFGMDKFNAGSSQYLTIVEGEDDVPAAYEILGHSYPVVGLPGATSPNKVFKNQKVYDYVNAFKHIIVATDGDDAGDRCADAIARLFPDKTYRVSLTKHKDAQEYLEKGNGSDFKWAWNNRKKYVPDNVLNTPDQFLELYRDTPEHMYVPTGISDLDEKILGLMQGHFTVFKAETGIGKTELLRMIEHKFLKEDVPIAAWHIEETKLRTLLGLVSYEAEENLTRKDLIEENKKEEEVQKHIESLTKDENFYQFFLRDGSTTDDLLEQIRYFVEACGVRYIFFEPIQDILGGDEQLLSELAIRLSKVAAELNVGIVTIAHTNENGDIKYCKMIGQRASVIIELQRDKEAESIEVRNTTTLYVKKNRPCSLEGWAGQVRFSPDTFTLSEIVG